MSTEQQKIPQLLLGVAIVIVLTCVASMFLLSAKVKELGSQVASMNLTIEGIVASHDQDVLSEKLTTNSDQPLIEIEAEDITESAASVADKIAANQARLKVYKTSLASLDAKIMLAMKGENSDDK